MGLALVLLVGLMVWQASYPLRDEIRLRRLQRQLQELQPAVEALTLQEEELGRLRKEISLLSEIHGRKGEILQVLSELSRVVPETAYLSNLRYRQGTIELRGSAENASNLVPLLENSRLFRNVRFIAPSNRGRDNRETFSLKLEIENGNPREVAR